MATPKISCKLGEGSKTLIRLPELAAPGLKICLATAIKQQQQHEAFQRSTGRSSTTLAKSLLSGETSTVSVQVA
jgi:hypothetical protein